MQQIPLEEVSRNRSSISTAIRTRVKAASTSWVKKTTTVANPVGVTIESFSFWWALLLVLELDLALVITTSILLLPSTEYTTLNERPLQTTLIQASCFVERISRCHQLRMLLRFVLFQRLNHPLLPNQQESTHQSHPIIQLWVLLLPMWKMWLLASPLCQQR